jgi:hypothetical protein
MDDLRRTAAAAAALSFGLALSLLRFVINVAAQPKAEVRLLIGLTAIPVVTCSTIFQWMACARKYIDYAIGRRLAAVGRE